MKKTKYLVHDGEHFDKKQIQIQEKQKTISILICTSCSYTRLISIVNLKSFHSYGLQLMPCIAVEIVKLTKKVLHWHWSGCLQRLSLKCICSFIVNLQLRLLSSPSEIAHNEDILRIFLMACEVRTVKLSVISLSCLQKLISHDAVAPSALKEILATLKNVSSCVCYF